jgi:thiamine biosynthesis lipoprotein
VPTDLLPPLVRQHRFEALGTYVHLGTTGDLARSVELAEVVLAEVDRTCSRFRPDSDLVRANARAGQWTEVDPLLAAAVAVALDAARESDGLVDPCLGRALVEIGYDQDLAAVIARGDARPVPPASAAPDAWREVQVDPQGAVLVPAGAELDLGATAKAWAADLLALSLVTEHPDGVGDELTPDLVTLDGGGLATSSTAVRRWRAGGVLQHHLLDPRTGRPAAPYWRTVTATGPTCVAANVASTAAIVLGAEAEGWLAARGVDARLVGVDGVVRRIGAWPAQPDSLPKEA